MSANAVAWVGAITGCLGAITGGYALVLQRTQPVRQEQRALRGMVRAEAEQLLTLIGEAEAAARDHEPFDLPANSSVTPLLHWGTGDAGRFTRNTVPTAVVQASADLITWRGRAQFYSSESRRADTAAELANKAAERALTSSDPWWREESDRARALRTTRAGELLRATPAAREAVEGVIRVLNREDKRPG